jgi:hypothetical protein
VDQLRLDCVVAVRDQTRPCDLGCQLCHSVYCAVHFDGGVLPERSENERDGTALAAITHPELITLVFDLAGQFPKVLLNAKYSASLRATSFSSNIAAISGDLGEGGPRSYQAEGRKAQVQGVNGACTEAMQRKLWNML